MLDYFAIKHGTDKSSLIHDYCQDYEDAIERYLKVSKQSYIKLLEIGVWSGASLRMWNDYFNCLGIDNTIVGIDIEPSASQYAELDIHIEIGSQTDKQFLEAVNLKHGPFDIIVDDGSHITSHQRQSFEVLFPCLNSGGLYIVEDVCTSYWKDFITPDEPTMIEYCKSLVDDVNFCGYLAEGKVDRRPYRLIECAKNEGLKLNTTVKSIHFLNSTIIIYKR